jgi:chaperonin cofactor prefoldin
LIYLKRLLDQNQVQYLHQKNWVLNTDLDKFHQKIDTISSKWECLNDQLNEINEQMQNQFHKFFPA